MTTHHDLTFDDQGAGRPVLLLHGGAGPQSVAGFAALLAAHDTRVITPTHPGFGGTPRPDTLTSVRGLAELYVGLLDELNLDDVTVIGNSVGGWIASEMALLDSRRISGLVLVDAVGIDVPEHPVVDFFALTPDEVPELSYHDPAVFQAPPPELLPVIAGNMASLKVYGGTSMMDPTLRDRLAGITVPTLVLWGESDRIVVPDYGRAFANAIPTARFRLLPATGHVPQIETPDQLLAEIRAFIAGIDRVSIVGPGAGEVMLDGPVKFRILEDGSNTGHRLGFGEIVLAPHTDGPPQHRHAQHDEGFYVISGTARFTVGETSHDVGPGTLVMVPPGAPHTFANPGDEPVVMVNTFTPDLYVQYFRDLRAMVQPMTRDAVVEVMGRYATTPATDFGA